MPSLPARSGQKRSDPQLRRHEPHQAPGEGFFQRPAGELVPLRGIHRHDRGGMVDGPGALAAASGDRCTERVLQGAAL